MPRQPVSGHDELMTTAEVASALRVAPVTVARWARAGKLTAVRTPGGQRRYKRADVDVILYPEAQR
jgi:excisionase family DNA binding protein